ncbi:cell adhesion molecule Dscam1-like isoform X2 [Oratosquilla oratoria]|uniref:cell adhesion molecule Dscam1-like isoform X2 n=1 Tax=Oratosquilla oratoria TaxID=337810 RepID=UPI003F7779F5
MMLYHFLWLVVTVTGLGAQGYLEAAEEEGSGPVFLHEPPSRLHFSNTTGALLPCSAHGNPPPLVEWISGGELVTDVAGIRSVHTNGSLQFLPFPPSAYTASVHAATYSCKASSAAGVIVSRPVHVRAGKRDCPWLPVCLCLLHYFSE